jgi:hypothetical protein
MCKACGSTLQSLSGTPLAGRLGEKWLDGVNPRKAHERTDINLDTWFRWWRRFLAAAAAGRQAPLRVGAGEARRAERLAHSSNPHSSAEERVDWSLQSGRR